MCLKQSGSARVQRFKWRDSGPSDHNQLQVGPKPTTACPNEAGNAMFGRPCVTDRKLDRDTLPDNKAVRIGHI